MVVRVRLRVFNRESGRGLVLTVLANGGAESDVPVIALNTDDASRLGLWPTSDYELVEVSLAARSSYGYVVPKPVLLELMDDNEVLSRVDAVPVVDPDLEEPLITDITIDELGIVVLSFSKGLWRHASDPPDKVRKSTAQEVSEVST